MFQTFPKNGSKGKAQSARNINGMKLSNQRDTGFYENQNLIGDPDYTRMNQYSKPGTSSKARCTDVMSLSYPITRFRSRRP